MTTTRTRIALGCDEAAFDLKEAVKALLITEHPEVDVIDHGVSSDETVDYPDVAVDVATSIVDGRADRGILMCGTGIGVAITANKVPGIRAAQAHDVYSAERARKSNNAQIITMGARVIGPELAKTIVRAWLASEFEAGRSGPKVDKINAVDARFHTEKSTSA